ASWVLRLTICCIAVLAVLTAELSPDSAWLRSDWMPADMLLSCCVSDCAALSTPIRADWLSELVDSPCTAVTRLLNAVSSVPVPPGVPWIDCRLLRIEERRSAYDAPDCSVRICCCRYRSSSRLTPVTLTPAPIEPEDVWIWLTVLRM